MPNLPYASPGWSTHHEVKIRQIEYPISWVPSHFTVLRTYEGPAETYRPLALNAIDPEFNGSNPSKPAAYFVTPGPLEDVDGGQVRYTRLFSTIPSSHAEYTADPFVFPALAGSGASSSVSITGIIQTKTSTTADITCDTTGISSGDSIYIVVSYDGVRADGLPFVTTTAGYFTVLNVVSSSVLTVARSFYENSPYTNISGTLRPASPGRYIAQRWLIPNKLTYDYFLTSDASSIALPALFDPIQITQATDGSGNPIGPEAGASVTKLSSSTSPTADEYRALIASGADLVVSSTLERYLGNIWKRTTRTVKAR